jgi:hypothetical protein
MKPTRWFRFYAINDAGDAYTAAIIRATDENDAVRRGFAMLTDAEVQAILRDLDGPAFDDPDEDDTAAFFTTEEIRTFNFSEE